MKKIISTVLAFLFYKKEKELPEVQISLFRL